MTLNKSKVPLFLKKWKLNFSKPRPDSFFVTFASFFGLMVLLLTPPFQVPDEINHFYRAYQISEGNFIAVKQDNRVGGYIPTSLEKITLPFQGLIRRMHAKTNIDTICGQFKAPLQPEVRKFIDFPNTAMYSPVSYFPQSLSIFILRIFHLSPLSLFYGARIFTLLFWILGISCAIRLMPFYKWSFAFIALLPMSLFVNMAISADVVTNLLSFILIAYILKLAYSEPSISTKNGIVICFLTVLLASAKIFYTPLILMILIIPKKKFPSNKAYYTQLATLVLVSFGTVLFWSKIMNSLYLPYRLYNTEFRDKLTLFECADMQGQTQYILSHGTYLWHVFVNSMKHSFDMYFQGFIGTFGWLDTKLPLWLVNSSYTVLFIAAITDGNRDIQVKPVHKIIFLAGSIITISLVLLSQHLTWDCVGGDIISTLQGRYFIPLFPLFFMLWYNSKFNYSKIVVPLIVIFSFISLSITLHTLLKRYYIPAEFKCVTIKCDAERVSKDHHYVTNLPVVLLGNGGTRSSEKARSGSYSAKLSPKNPFAFTYSLFNCSRGDIIHVNVWRFGTVGDIIIAGESNAFYFGESQPFEKDSAGWGHLELKLIVPDDMKNKEIGIYLFNNSQDSSYFDDLVISYKKLQ
jgi:uncharacterized membrane protein